MPYFTVVLGAGSRLTQLALLSLYNLLVPAQIDCEQGKGVDMKP